LSATQGFFVFLCVLASPWLEDKYHKDTKRAFSHNQILATDYTNFTKSKLAL
jgi:hypothetical protein